MCDASVSRRPISFPTDASCSAIAKVTFGRCSRLLRHPIFDVEAGCFEDPSSAGSRAHDSRARHAETGGSTMKKLLIVLSAGALLVWRMGSAPEAGSPPFAPTIVV